MITFSMLYINIYIYIYIVLPLIYQEKGNRKHLMTKKKKKKCKPLV
jgi:hypothetical protein